MTKTITREIAESILRLTYAEMMELAGRLRDLASDDLERNIDAADWWASFLNTFAENEAEDGDE